MATFPLPTGTYNVGYPDTWGAARPNGRTHQGVDIGAPIDTPLLAIEAGQLTDSSGGAGGTAVTLDTGAGGTWYYAHLSRIAGQVPRTVTEGETIGYVGMTGNTSGPHLHIMRAVGGVPQEDSHATLKAIEGFGTVTPAGGVTGLLEDALGLAGDAAGIVPGSELLGQLVGPVQQITKGLLWLADRDNWLRIMQVMAGAGLVTLGAVVLFRDILTSIPLGPLGSLT